MVSSIVADMSVATMEVFGKRDASDRVTAPVPAPTSRMWEDGTMGDRVWLSWTRREAERAEVRPTLVE